MKKNIKMLIMCITLLFCSSVTYGYNFIFSNVTERFLVICYKLEALSQEYYQIIPPDQSISHYFYNVHCFGGSILWAELKETDAFGNELPFQGGIALVDPETGEIPLGVAQNLFKTTLANRYAFIPMQIKVVDNETFQMTADAAEELVQGIDELSCQTIKTVAQFMSPIPTPSIPTATNGAKESGSEEKPGTMQLVINKISSLAGSSKSDESPQQQPTLKQCRFGLGQIAKAGAGLAGISLCRDLHFVIVDTGEIGTPAPTKPGVIRSRVKKPILLAEINQGG